MGKEEQKSESYELFQGLFLLITELISFKLLAKLFLKHGSSNMKGSYALNYFI